MAIQSAPIPVKGNPQYIAEAITDSDVTPNLYNGYINKMDTPVIMPGLTDFFNTGTAEGIDGMFWWESQEALIVVSKGEIFKKTTKTVAEDWANVSGGVDMITGNKCTFADFDTKLIIANGGKLKVLPDTGLAYDMPASRGTGTITGSDDTSVAHATVMTDSTATGWVTNSFVGLTITNATDFSAGTVTSNTATTITCSGGLVGGTADVWNADDVYSLAGAPLYNNDPSAVKFVTAYDSYCVALQDVTGYFFWSKVGDPENWDGAFNSAQTHPDTTNAVKTGWGELILTGSKSFEVWRNDGSTPFVPNRSAYSETGVIAPDSLLLINGTWVMLSDDRQLVFLNGRQPKSLSSSLDAYIQTFTTINDCRSSMLQLDGADYLLLTFPTEAKSLLVNLKPDRSTGDNIWTELANYVAPNWTQYNGQDSVVCSSWNMVVVGGEDDGQVYILDQANEKYDTLDVLMSYRTQWIDREYSGNKRSYGVRAFIKRLKPSTEPLSVFIRYRDNGSQTWGTWVSRTYTDEAEFTELFRIDGPMGMYHSRQFEFALQGEPLVALVRAEELIEISHI